MADQKSVQMSPKTAVTPQPGSVQAEYKRCGKPACRCARGDLHGPYYRQYWRVRGRRVRRYVRLADFEDVAAGCAARREREYSRRRLMRTIRHLEMLSREAAHDAWDAQGGAR